MPTTVNLRWHRWRPGIDYGQHSLDIVYYTVGYQQINASVWVQRDEIASLDTDPEYTYTVDGLLPHTQYKFRIVLSWLDAGKSTESIPSAETAFI